MDGSNGGKTIRYVIDTPGAFYSVNGVTMYQTQTGHYSITSNGLGYDVGVTDMSVYQNAPVGSNSIDYFAEHPEGSTSEDAAQGGDPFDRLNAGGNPESQEDIDYINNAASSAQANSGSSGSSSTGNQQTNTPDSTPVEGQTFQESNGKSSWTMTWHNTGADGPGWYNDEDTSDVSMAQTPFPTNNSGDTIIVVTPGGNALPVPAGGTLTGSQDGKYIQVRNPDGSETGTRIDGGHKPSTHPDPRAQGPHAHVPGVTNPDGTPWLPVKPEPVPILTSRQITGGVAIIGTGYLIYRGVRMLPSLTPWTFWTIPANLATP